IPHNQQPNPKTRLAWRARCCPDCGLVSRAPILRQYGATRPFGGALKALSPATWLDRWRFAVQIGLAKNLIWTGVVPDISIAAVPRVWFSEILERMHPFISAFLLAVSFGSAETGPLLLRAPAT